MQQRQSKICVCICTCGRPQMLERLLNHLEGQQTGDVFEISVVVADNDREQSAKITVESFAAKSQIPITYCCEPRRNIALARNKALEYARGDFVAFIDDDEFPSADWLLLLFKTCNDHD